MICESLNTVKPDMSVIPAFASLNESAYYVVEAIERDFTELIKSIGIHELGIFESTGSVLLYEEQSEEAKEVNEKKEGFLVAVWSKVKAIFEKFLAKIKEVYANYLNNKVSKINLDDLKKNVSNLKDDFSISTYEYEELRKVLKSQELNDIYAVNPNSKDEIIASKDNEENSASKIAEKLKGKAIKLSKSDIASNFDTIASAVKDYKTTQNNLKMFYNSTKAYFDKLIKEEKEAKDHSKENLNALKIKANRQVLYVSAVLSNYYQMFATDVKIMLILANATGKKAKAKSEEAKADEKKPEKVEGEVVDKKDVPNVNKESAFDSELSSLFDWNY